MLSSFGSECGAMSYLSGMAWSTLTSVLLVFFLHVMLTSQIHHYVTGSDVVSRTSAVRSRGRPGYVASPMASEERFVDEDQEECKVESEVKKDELPTVSDEEGTLPRNALETSRDVEEKAREIDFSLLGHFSLDEVKGGFEEKKTLDSKRVRTKSVARADDNASKGDDKQNDTLVTIGGVGMWSESETADKGKISSIEDHALEHTPTILPKSDFENTLSARKKLNEAISDTAQAEETPAVATATSKDRWEPLTNTQIAAQTGKRKTGNILPQSDQGKFKNRIGVHAPGTTREGRQSISLQPSLGGKVGGKGGLAVKDHAAVQLGRRRETWGVEEVRARERRMEEEQQQRRLEILKHARRVRRRRYVADCGLIVGRDFWRRRCWMFWSWGL